MILRFIDDFLNRTTMYRLLVYYLGSLLGVAAVFSSFGILPYNPIYMLGSAGFLVAICWLVNVMVARIWNVPTNAESSLITALILALIITPEAPVDAYPMLVWVGVLAMASKYVLTYFNKHIFNPAALAVAIAAVTLQQSATWWVGGDIAMMAFVVAGGLLIVRKIHRLDLVAAFLCVAIVSTVVPILLGGRDVVSGLTALLIHTPIFFFAFVMLTEPLTTPPRRLTRVLYGGIVGLLFAPWVHIASIYFTPELALLAGNVFSYVVSPKFKALLKLKEVKTIAQDTYEYVFDGASPIFRPGQYAEWTIGLDAADTRGNRRYFTLASSPTEEHVRLGIKFYPQPSAFKEYLALLKPGEHILAGSVGGDFTLPEDTSTKLVFIAGGIGVTPFRSMVKYMIDTHEKRDAILLYSNRTAAEIAYRDVFDVAQQSGNGFRAVYTLTNEQEVSTWDGHRGVLDAAMIAREVPDFRDRIFFISGPHGMVVAFQTMLAGAGVPQSRIHVDYFPGFA